MVVKKLNQIESAQNIFMQVEVDVKCMHTNFGGHSLSSFGNCGQKNFNFNLVSLLLLFLFITSLLGCLQFQITRELCVLGRDRSHPLHTYSYSARGAIYPATWTRPLPEPRPKLIRTLTQHTWVSVHVY